MNPAIELRLPALWLVHYGLLLARTAGIVVFLPLPGLQRVPATPKIVLAAALAFLMTPLADVAVGMEIFDPASGVWLLARRLAAEAALGLAIGVAFRLLTETFGLAAQALGFQAGYSYVNMVDPTSEVDASILNVLFALLAGLLFFALDLHLFAVRVFANSLEAFPLGAFATEPVHAAALIRLSADMVAFALRLALPVIGLLLLIDLTLGLLNQVHPRMQLLTLAFPAKIIAAAAALYPVLLSTPRVYESFAERVAEWLLALTAG